MAAELPNAAVAVADVTDRAAVDRAFAEARSAHGPVGILIANAGAAESAPFAKIDAEAWRRAMAVNLDAVFHCCQAALPDLTRAAARADRHDRLDRGVARAMPIPPPIPPRSTARSG